jgi:hypothetical protein
MIVGAIFALLLPLVVCDVYMHNPRGSNDRNCERNVNRNNGNRLFNSQNNNNGGYACQRGVGDRYFQSENGTATFSTLDTTTGDVKNFYQSKRMYYYSGSVLPIEWTNQHGCGGNSKASCEIVLQYACEDTLDPRVDNFWPWVANKNGPNSQYYGTQHFRAGDNIAAPRDGVPINTDDAATDTIPVTEDAAIPDTLQDQRFGMHENYDYYDLCSRTERNKGLYTADQLIQRNDRRGTRQNPVGNRHGFECPEERDYYPWWAPSPWIDIAVLSDNAGDSVCYPFSTNCTTRCTYYMNNTMNFHSKGYCDVAHNSTSNIKRKLNNRYWQNSQWFNNREACEANHFVWFEVSHSDNLNLPNNSFVCAHTQFARVNQLGNGDSNQIISQNAISGVVNSHVSENLNANRFMWTIPEIPTAKQGSSYFSDMERAYFSCTLRMRYNISSADFQAWPKDAVDTGTPHMVDYHNNSKHAYDPNTPLTQDPYVYIGPGDSSSKGMQFVKLKVNTNQYSRTFQDRSYVFAIKPLPTTSASANNMRDSPSVDATAVHSALSKGGKIYNVNVRGKRGNIVQVYPSVEYDFVPNALALGTSDMIHFQWTGSDYNPRRGCNDATGGPPDLNTYFTDANADQNPRADRSNVVLTQHMGYNVPADYLGFDHSMSANMTYEQMLALANSTVLQNAPCYNPSTDSHTVAQECYATLMRLAYLNQQTDLGSLTLRQGKRCLTQTQLDAILNQDVADFHPLNCAKLNAKPYPYFDGGIMFMRNSGWFPFFSSRNNNFSNRQQIGVICVGSSCSTDKNGILQDKNPNLNAASIVKRVSTSTCYNTAMGGGSANANAAHTCLPTTANATANAIASSILTLDTEATQEGDTDVYGDGNARGCAAMSARNVFTSGTTVERNIALAFILLAVGIVFSWLAYYLYNRYQARRAGESKFRYDTAWQSAAPVEKRTARPTSESYSDNNPGIKMTRPKKANVESAPARSASPSRPDRPAAKGGYSNLKPAGGPRIQRTDMI